MPLSVPICDALPALTVRDPMSTPPLPHPNKSDAIGLHSREDVTPLRSFHRAGFTLIEVMLAVLIMIIGLVGIIAMQIVAIQANGAARDLTEATNVAEHFVALLQQDGSSWNGGGTLDGTIYLTDLDTTPDTWLPISDQPMNVLGVPREDLAGLKGAGRAKYCVAYKLHWGVQDAVITGFVRVFWPRISSTQTTAGCGTGTGVALTDLDIAVGATDRTSASGISMVTLPLTVRRTDVF